MLNSARDKITVNILKNTHLIVLELNSALRISPDESVIIKCFLGFF